MSYDSYTIIRLLAEKCIQRMTALGYIGQRRDEATLDFWVGASTMAAAISDGELAEAIARVGVLEVKTHGFEAVKKLVM